MTAQPICPVFGECGGCDYQDISYPEELKRKEILVKSLLRNLSLDDELFDPVVASPNPYHYRNRLDLKFVRTRDERVLVGFTPKSRHGITTVESCAIAAPAISDHILTLKKYLEKTPPKDYRRANIVVRAGDDPRVLWGGIGKRSCRLSPEDYLWTTLQGKKIFYSLDTFFQANLSILPKLFERIERFDCWQSKPVLYDLYAGVGLFSLGLSDYARKAILIEESTNSITLARHNVAYHNLKHLDIVSGRMEDTLPPLLVAQDPAVPAVAIVDPPRSGLSPGALKMLINARAFKHLFYLSCNPEALGPDLNKFIAAGWTIQKIMPFDFFPKTRHIETLVLLTP